MLGRPAYLEILVKQLRYGGRGAIVVIIIIMSWPGIGYIYMPQVGLWDEKKSGRKASWSYMVI